MILGTRSRRIYFKPRPKVDTADLVTFDDADLAESGEAILFRTNVRS
jgi:hypothetical protein